MLSRPNGSQGSSRFNRSDDSSMGLLGSALNQTVSSMDVPENVGGVVGLVVVAALEVYIPAMPPVNKLLLQVIPAFLAGNFVVTGLKKKAVGQATPELKGYEFPDNSYQKYSHKGIDGLKSSSMQRPDRKTEGGGITPVGNLGPDNVQCRSHSLPNMRVSLPGNFSIKLNQKDNTQTQPSLKTLKTNKPIASISNSFSNLDWDCYVIIVEKLEVSDLPNPNPNETQDVIKESTSWYSDFTDGLYNSWSSLEEDVPQGGGVDDSEWFFDSSCVEIVIWSGAIFLGGKIIGQFVLWVGRTKKDN